MTHRTAVRVALGYLLAMAATIGLWATVAPRSFYDDFPGLGRAWVSVDGPYNEHLVRDVGGLNLALAVLLVVAAVSLARPLVTTAALASLVWGIPHLAYHASSTDVLGTLDNVLSLTGLTAAAAFPLVLLRAARHLDDAGPGRRDAPT